MGRPTAEELACALAEAGRMREHDEDPDHLAKCLLNFHYRLQLFEQLYEQVEHYVRSGQDQTQHGKLMRVLDKLHSEERHPGLDRH